MEYTLARSRRKSVTIFVRDGAVMVRAPLKTSLRFIEDFIARKKNWILKSLESSAEARRSRENFLIDYGGAVTYRGIEYPVCAAAKKRAAFDGEKFCVPQNLTPHEIKKECVKIYRKLAKRDITERVFMFAEKLSLTPSAVRITSANRQWGSCTGRGSVNFSWRLIIAPDDLIDYVITHELVHLKIMNHSSRFWNMMEKAMPDYRERKARLRTLQDKLAREDW